ncbi:Rossmann fold domain-containing protein [Tsuneonella sp. HG249]
MIRIDARDLSDNPIDAASEFLGRAVPEVRAALRGGSHSVCVVFDVADHTHSAWRTAAIQSLAREAAPARVNAVAGSSERAIASGHDYLQRAPGVTAQYLVLNDGGAAKPTG